MMPTTRTNRLYRARATRSPEYYARKYPLDEDEA